MNSIIALIGLCAATASSPYNGYPIPGYSVPNLQRMYVGAGYSYPSGYQVQGPQYTDYPAYPAAAGYPLVIPQRVAEQPPFEFRMASTYPIGRKSLPNVPAYTLLLKTIDEKFDDVRRHLTGHSAHPSPPTLNTGPETAFHSPYISYAMILNAVYQLVDGIFKNKGMYNDIYYGIVGKVVVQAKKHRFDAVESALSSMNKTMSDIALIRDIIKQKQQHCADPYSHDCDLTIETAVQESADPRLKTEAKFLVALGKVGDIFTSDYRTKFEEVVHSNGAEAYLIKDDQHLKPLVLAAYEARKAENEVAVSRSSNSSYHDLS